MFSRFCELVPVLDKSYHNSPRVHENHNTPNEIDSNNGSEFFNSLPQSLCNTLKKIPSSSITHVDLTFDFD